MDIDELRSALVGREAFAPDSDAVLGIVLAHPPTERVRPHRRLFAAIGIAAAVVLIAGTVSVVRSTTPDPIGQPPTPAIPSPSHSALATTLERIFWSIGTVTPAGSSTPISATFRDTFSLAFNSDGTVMVSSPNCASQTVHWTVDDSRVTISTLSLQQNRCTADPGAPGRAAVPLSAAYRAMTTGATSGHLDGRSLVLTAGADVLVFRNQSPMPSIDGQPSIDTAVRRWAGFPLTAHPRPVVLLSAAVVLPAEPLPDGNQENALAAGRIVLRTTSPTTPSAVRGYPIIDARTAIAQFTDSAQVGSGRPALHITHLQVVDHDYLTDRGEVPLPTWKVALAESHDPIYVVAVAAAGRYPATLADALPLGQYAALTGDGRDITVPFTAHHVSQGGCDRDRTATLVSKETSTAVVIAVTEQLHPAVPQPGCTDGYTFAYSSYLAPGEPDTATVHLQQALGNRVVVDQMGTPYAINSQ